MPKGTGDRRSVDDHGPASEQSGAGLCVLRLDTSPVPVPVPVPVSPAASAALAKALLASESRRATVKDRVGLSKEV